MCNITFKIHLQKWDFCSNGDSYVKKYQFSESNSGYIANSLNYLKSILN